MIAVDKGAATKESRQSTTGDAMTSYDFLQFSVCVFSILAAGSGFSQQPPGWRNRPQKPAGRVLVYFRKR